MKDYAVLIPTKSRPAALTAMFKRVPELNSADTFLGIEPQEHQLYGSFLEHYGNLCTIVDVHNPKGFVGNAREALRAVACNIGFDRYFLTDDNASFNRKSFNILLHAQKLEGCVMSGMGVPETWHADAIANGTLYTDTPFGDLVTFESYSTVHWIVPHHLYSKFAYPKDVHNDDVFFALWAILDEDYRTFRSCQQAKYSKKRFQPGGNGEGNERLLKMARGMLQLATAFPEVADHSWMATRFPFAKIVKEIPARRAQ